MKKLNGFTLAEVLITLMIIGVIAAMTIPGLRQNTDSRANMTSLKKFYSEFSQAIARAMGDTTVNTVCKTGLLDTAASTDEEFVNNYFNVASTCGEDQTNCFGKNIDYFSGDKTYLLSSGMSFTIENVYTCQDDNTLGTFNILVDVNGPKKPNKGGVDVFMLTLHNDGTLYMGSAYWIQEGQTADATAQCMSDGDDYNNAWACASKIFLDGWEMKY